MSLYNKIAHALTHYSIDELGLLPCTPVITDIPSSAQKYHPLMVVECKLGVSLDDLGQLLKEAQEKITEHKQQQSFNDASWELVTRVMVLLKPEHYTAMNARKQLVISGQVSIEDELHLNQLIFTIPRNTKSSIAWYHREWLFTHTKQGADHMDLENELALCQRSITLYPRNYYAWGYRCWLLTWMTTNAQQQQQQQQNMSNKNDSIAGIVELEYRTASQWLQTNISDHTGMRYMEKALELWTSSQQQRYPILERHMVWLDDLILRYPGHESLWCHRRYCATLFFNYGTHHPSSTLHQWLKQQHVFIEQLLKSSNDRYHEKHSPKEDENNTRLRQLGFAAKYGLWLCFLETRQQIQTDGGAIRNSLVDFYMDQLQQLDDVPIYLQYLKQNWAPPASLHAPRR